MECGGNIYVFGIIWQRRQWHPTPVLLPGKSHGQRSAVHGVTKSRERVSNFTFIFHFHELEKEMAAHSSPWRIPGTGEPGGLPSMGSQRVGHYWSDLAVAVASEEVKSKVVVFNYVKKIMATRCVSSQLSLKQEGNRAEGTRMMNYRIFTEVRVLCLGYETRSLDHALLWKLLKGPFIILFAYHLHQAQEKWQFSDSSDFCLMQESWVRLLQDSKAEET